MSRVSKHQYYLDIAKPCLMCERKIKNAGISRLFTSVEEGG